MADGEIKVVFKADSKEVDAVMSKVRSMSGGGSVAAKGAAAGAKGEEGRPSATHGLGGLSALSVSGIPYISTVARAFTSSLGVMALTVGTATLAVRKLAQMMAQTAEQLAKLSVGAFLSNRPIGFAAQMSTIGGTFGVGEREAITLTWAVRGLAEQFAATAATLAKIAPVMTDMHIKTSAWSASLKALFADMFAGMAPAVARMADAMRLMFETIRESYLFDALRRIFGGFMDVVSGLVSAMSVLISSFMLGINVIGDFAAFVIDRLVNIASFGMTDRSGATGNVPMLSESTVRMAEGVNRQIRRLLEGGAPQINIPQSGGANRLPASPWEKMGLVLGAGGGNPARETAQNTRRTADILGKILEGMSRGGGMTMKALVPTA